MGKDTAGGKSFVQKRFKGRWRKQTEHAREKARETILQKSREKALGISASQQPSGSGSHDVPSISSGQGHGPYQGSANSGEFTTCNVTACTHSKSIIITGSNTTHNEASWRLLEWQTALNAHKQNMRNLHEYDAQQTSKRRQHSMHHEDTPRIHTYIIHRPSRYQFILCTYAQLNGNSELYAFSLWGSGRKQPVAWCYLHAHVCSQCTRGNEKFAFFVLHYFQIAAWYHTCALIPMHADSLTHMRILEYKHTGMPSGPIHTAKLMHSSTQKNMHIAQVKFTHR